MARRTRRNLSDPRIKKIIKQPAGSAAPRRKPARSRSKDQSAFFTSSVAALLLILLVVTLGYLFRQPLMKEWQTLSDYWNRAPERKSVAQQAPPPEKNAPLSPTPSSQTETPPPESPPPATRRIQVEVLNGCGVAGLAKEVTKYLRKQNIDVVGSGNYKNFAVEKSFILDRIGNPERSGQAAKLLGIPAEQIVKRIAPELQLDVTIVIGKDYKSLEPFLTKR